MTLDFIAAHPWTQALLGLTLLFAAALLADWLTKRIVVRTIRRQLRAASWTGADFILENRIVGRFAHIVPAIIVYQGTALVPHLPPFLASGLRGLAAGLMILTVVLALSAVLNLVNDVYQTRPLAHSRPIKGYIQVIKILLYAAALVLAIAVMLGRSPLLLLSGLGAMAAVLMLVFKDTILSLVASVQLTSNDMIRVGDWIEMPQLNADGDVIDIALHTVKVQNWDKTITTIPTYRLITESFKNWRGMSEAGGRRIKRSLYIDQNSIRFLAPAEREELRRFMLIDEYLAKKRSELDEWNRKLEERGKEAVNTRRVTNIGTFRAYVFSYLQHHPSINSGMTLLVRQLEPGPSGLPLEIYCFTSVTEWRAYEDIQSDIFDHLLAVLPEFRLRLFQQPSGLDLAAAAAGLSGRPSVSRA
jgi:miniconductance mechanosensitive channel